MAIVSANLLSGFWRLLISLVLIGSVGNLRAQQFESAFEHYTVNKSNPILRKNAFLAVESPTGFVKMDYPIGPGLVGPRGGLSFAPTARVHLIPKNAPHPVATYNVGPPPAPCIWHDVSGSDPRCTCPDSVLWRRKYAEARSTESLPQWWTLARIVEAEEVPGELNSYVFSYFDFNAGTSSVDTIDPGHGELFGSGRWNFVLPTGEPVNSRIVTDVNGSTTGLLPHVVYPGVLTAFGYSEADLWMATQKPSAWGSGGHLLFFLNTQDPPISFLDDLHAGNPLNPITCPRKVLVTKGDLAYEFTFYGVRYAFSYGHNRGFDVLDANFEIYGATQSPWQLPNGGWVAKERGYLLSAIRNRMGDEIRFTQHADGVGYTATLFVDQGGGQVQLESVSLNYQTTEGQSCLSLEYGPSVGRYTLTVESTIGYVYGCEDRNPSPGKIAMPHNNDWMDRRRHMRVKKVVHEATKQTATFEYEPAWLDGFPYLQGSPLLQPCNNWISAPVLKQATFPNGERIDLEYQAATFYSPYAYMGDLYSVAPPSYKSVGWGVSSLTRTDLDTGVSRRTTYSRKFPDYETRVSASTPYSRNVTWTSTLFYDAETQPDGTTVVRNYVPPVNDPMNYDISTPAGYQTFISTRHAVMEMAVYPVGTDWKTDVEQGRSLAQSTLASHVTLYDGWDVRGLGANGVDSGQRGELRAPYPSLTLEYDALTKISKRQWTGIWNSAAETWTKSGTDYFKDRLPDSFGFTAFTRNLSDGQSSLAGAEVSRSIIQAFQPLAPHYLPGVVIEKEELQGGVPRAPKLTRTVIPKTGVAIKESWSDGRFLEFTYADHVGLPSQVVLDSTPRLPLGGQVGAKYRYDDCLNRNWIQPLSGVTYSVSQTTDPLLRVPLTQTGPDGLIQSYSWDELGRPTTLTPPGETATNLNFPSLRELILTRGAQTSHQYANAFGELIREVRFGANGPSHRKFGYDPVGRKTWETVWMAGEGVDAGWDQPYAPGDTYTPPTAGQAGSTEIRYLGERCVLYSVDENGDSYCVESKPMYQTIVHPAVPATDAVYGYGEKATRWHYDLHGRLEWTSPPTLEKKEVTFSKYALRTKTVSLGWGLTNAETPQAPSQLIETTFETDVLGRLVKVTDAKGQVTEYTYDSADRVIKVTQWSGAVGGSPKQERTWTYDARGWLTQMVQPESGLTTYSEFDVTGKPWSTSYNGRIVDSPYDAQGHVLSVTAKDGSVAMKYVWGTEPDRFAAKLKTATATVGGVSKQLDYYPTTGRLKSLTRTVDGASFTQNIDYDAMGRIENRSYPDGKAQTFQYNPAIGLPSSTGFVGSPVANLHYEDVSWNLDILAFAGGANSASTTYAYGPDQVRLARMNHSILGKLDKTWEYTYDNLGRLSTDKEDWYSYDELGRLKAAVVRDPFDSATGNEGRGLIQEFGYDAFGNRISSLSRWLGAWTKGSSPNSNIAAMQPDPILRGGLEHLANASFSASDPALLNNQMPATSYLPNGTPVATSAHYDAQGNLDRVYTTPGDTDTRVNMTYDALGRVTSLSYGPNASRVTEQYLYDDDGLRIRIWDGTKYRYNIYNEARQLIAQYERTKKADGTWNVPVWKKDIINVGTKEIAEVSPTGTSITMTDHLGSPRFVWAGGSSAVVPQKFLPFGEQLGTAGTAKGFTNHEQTDASKLIYMQARMYLPAYGRFASPDPARDQHFEDTQSWNIYSYCMNNPVMMTDPTGMYVFADGTTKDQRKLFDDSLARARESLGNDKLSASEKAAISRGIDAYGKAGEANGVTVGFKAMSDGSAASAGFTGVSASGDGYRADVFVAINSQNTSVGNQLAADIAHEGSHTADKQEAVARTGPDGDFMKSPGNITVKESEQRAYSVTASVLAGLPGSSKYEPSRGGVIYDPKAVPAQRGGIATQGINKVLSGTNPLYPTEKLQKRILEAGQ